tara:strand:+ start:149 stop:673 length:525 start_codon:yes stop_codon:yes gene_type:complete
MKQVLVLLISYLFISCDSGDNNVSKKGELIGSIESKAMIGDLTAEEYEPSWLNVENRKEMIADWFDKIRNGKQEVFEYFPDTLIPLSIEDLKYQFHHIDTEYIELSVYEMDTIIFEEKIDLDGIVYLKFKEDLYYDKSTGAFSKVVKYVCPMEKTYNEDGSLRGYKGLFWVKVN